MSKTDLIWLIIGFGGQGLFTARFVVQWLKSEKQRRSIIPLEFWYLSLFGGLTLLMYAVHKRDPVFVLGQLFGVVIYIRNLYFIYHERRIKNACVSQ